MDCYQQNKVNQDITISNEVKLQVISFACGYSFSNQEHISNHFRKNQFLERQLKLKIQEIKKAYEKHQIDLAYKLIQQYNYLEKTNNYHETNHNQNKILIDEILQEYNWMIEYKKNLEPNRWTLQNDNNNVKISTRYQQSSVSVLIESQINVPIQLLLSVISQFDLLHHIMPFMESSKLVKTYRRNIKIGYTLNDFPILSKRQALFDGYGYDRLDNNNTIFMFSRSIHNRPDLLQLYGLIFQKHKKYVQVDYNFLLIEYHPINSQKGYLKFAINADLKIPLPLFILKSTVQGFCTQFLENILKVTNSFKGSEWEKKMKENPQFFLFIKNRIIQYRQY